MMLARVGNGIFQQDAPASAGERTWALSFAVACVMLLVWNVSATGQTTSDAVESRASSAASETKSAGPPDSVEPLSVRPKNLEIVNEDQRPAWVEREPFVESGVLVIPVAGDPKPTPDEATESAILKAVDRAKQYVEQNSGVPSPAFLSDSFVRDSLVREPVYVEELRSPTFGTLYMGHARLDLDRSFLAKLDALKRAAQQRERVEATAVLAGGSLIVLALVGLWFGRTSRHVSHAQHWEPPPGMAEATATNPADVPGRSLSAYPRERQGGWWPALLMIAVIGSSIVFFGGYFLAVAPGPHFEENVTGPMESPSQDSMANGRRRLVGKTRASDGGSTENSKADQRSSVDAARGESIERSGSVERSGKESKKAPSGPGPADDSTKPHSARESSP